jgi:low temperature requirement protein LtrA
MLVLAALWWAWAAYAWLTNTLDPEKDANRLTMFVAMASMLVASLAVPGAFSDDALIFALAYTGVRASHILLYGLAANDVGVRAAVKKLAPPSAVGCVLLIVASQLDGWAQGACWVVALAVDYLGPVIAGMKGWMVSAGHFAERHGLIIIIALGESIVAVGVGAKDVELGAGEIAAAVLGIAVSAALWWAYFDVVALVAERRMHAARGIERVRMARDSYSYLHLPMIAGVVLLALGLKKTLEHVDEPLKLIPAIALCGGVALYLAAHVAFRLRNVHSLSRPRLTALGACLAAIPLATEVDALVALAIVATITSLLITYEVVAYREARARVRAAHGG